MNYHRAILVMLAALAALAGLTVWALTTKGANHVANRILADDQLLPVQPVVPHPVSRPAGAGRQVPPLQLGADRLLAAIRAVESAGWDDAVGDHGRSRGPFQCGRAAWAESCAYGKVHWPYDTCVWQADKAGQVVLWYAARWGAKTPEEVSRCWNSGPAWKSKYKLTDSYWAKVKKEMGK